MAEWGLHSDGSLDMLAKNMNTKALTKKKQTGENEKRCPTKRERDCISAGQIFSFSAIRISLWLYEC